MGLSFDDLRWFTCVARERSVSRAARQIGVTQQAVSERIARLERRVGTPLFTRLSHGMEPTTAAHRLVPYAERALALLDEALLAIDQEAPLRVSVHAPVAAAAVPLLREALGAAAFEVEEAGDVDRILAAVADGTADVGIGPLGTGRTSPSPARGGGPVVVEQLSSDPVVCVTLPDHPLATASRVHLTELNAHHVAFDVWGGGSSAGAGGATGLSGEGAVKVCPRSTVVGALADGALAEVAVVDLPPWVVPILMAYRVADAERPEVARLRGAALAAAGPGGEAWGGEG